MLRGERTRVEHRSFISQDDDINVMFNRMIEITRTTYLFCNGDK